MKHTKATAKALVRKAGSKDQSHVARVLNGGWKRGACHYIQQNLSVDATVVAKAIRKVKAYRKQVSFSTLPKAIARVRTIQSQAKALHIRKAR